MKSDKVTLAQPGTPALVGEEIVIYCTGLGAVTPAVQEGAPAPTTPLSNTVNPVTVTIGGAGGAGSVPRADAGVCGVVPGECGSAVGDHDGGRRAGGAECGWADQPGGDDRGEVNPDSGNNIVVRISPDGMITVVAGSGNQGFYS